MPNPSIVDKLVRAAAAVPADIPDDELNRHVADILAKEAKEKESKWREMGIGVYLEDKSESSSRAPKPNTRFLKSLVRDVDGHNTSLLREQAQAARAAAADKFYKDPKLQPGNGARSRHSEDPDVARMKRLFGGVVGNAANSRSLESPASHSSSSRHLAASGSDSRHHHSTSATHGGAAGSWRRESANHSGSRFDREDEASEDEDKGWSRKDVGRSKPRSAMQRAEEEEAKHRRRKRLPEAERGERRGKERQRSRSPVSSSRRREIVAEPKRQLPPDHYPSAGPAIPSKMDRYFEPTYDPKKDYRAMLDAQDVAVPRTGLVPNVDIGWDSMLSTIKYRGETRDRVKDRVREKEREHERDRDEREREKERRSRFSREKEKSRSTTDGKPSRREDRSPSVISIRGSSEESKSETESESDSWSSSSSSQRRKKRKHASPSKLAKDRSGKKSSKRHKSDKSRKKRRGQDSDDSDRERERKKVLVGGYEYVSKGAVREWDRGK